jgi:membrane protease YdiL (CAAX protease family)
MKPLTLFLLLTFGLFIAGFALVGTLFALGSPNSLIVLVQIAMAWTPTVAFAIVHGKVHPGRSFGRTVAGLFAPRIRLLPLLAAILIPVVATLVVWLGYALATDQAPLALLADLSLGGLVVIFLDGLIRGPLGEELGWRGYLQNELNQRHSLLKASLIVGVIWAIWHLPLWFISGYQGVDLLLYILFFAVGLIAFSVIIGFVYGRGRNLLYAILLHQMLNFSGRLLEMDELVMLGGVAAVYVVMAVVIGVVWLRAEPRPEVERSGRVVGKAA